jgi:galactokinase
MRSLGLPVWPLEGAAGLHHRVCAALPAAGPAGAPPVAFLVPGRIEVLGKHTDYGGGRSLVCAVERGFVVAATPRADDVVGVTDVVLGERVEGRLAADTAVGGTTWATYVQAVLRRFARNFPDLRRGADLAVGSDLPGAAGLSSSSALVTGLFLAIASVNDIELHPAYRDNVRSTEDLASYLATIENGAGFGTLEGDASGVGTFGGSEDHVAMLTGRRGSLVQYAFCPTRHERTIPLPDTHVFAIAASGVVAEKTGAARDRYNRASLALRRVLELYDEATSMKHDSIAQACTSSPEAINRIRRLLETAVDDTFAAPELQDRFEQFVEETFGIVPTAGHALLRHDLQQFGWLVARSQAAAERRLGNQVPETMALARSARSLGAPAASAFGAGFGGSVWALVERTQADAFLAEWRDRYEQEFPEAAKRAEFFLTGAGRGAGGIGAR